MAAGEGKSVYFPIVPSSLGNVELIVSAQSTQAADAVRRQLLVEVKHPSAITLPAAKRILIFCRFIYSFFSLGGWVGGVFCLFLFWGSFAIFALIEFSLLLSLTLFFCFFVNTCGDTVLL